MKRLLIVGLLLAFSLGVSGCKTPVAQRTKCICEKRSACICRGNTRRINCECPKRINCNCGKKEQPKEEKK